MAEATVVDLDVRELIPRERHATIFARFDALMPGETLRLINDHDPKPLYYQMMAERSGMFAWEPEQQGPEDWVIRIRRTAPASSSATDSAGARSDIDESNAEQKRSAGAGA